MSNIKDLFVSYEIAKQLKEKGFNEECFKYYEYDKRLETPNGVTICICKNEMFLDLCAAPLYQQAVDWFREEHAIAIGEDLTRTMNSCCFRIAYKGSLLPHLYFGNNYYEALNKAIEEAIKLI